MPVRPRYRVGIDIGGTFTDVVLRSNSGETYTRKSRSTPHDYCVGILTGLQELLRENGIQPDAIDDAVHATTVATNAILENSGAKTGLITTAGFRDVLEFRRIRIPVMYDLTWEKPKALVPRRRRLEVKERMRPDGSVSRALDENSVRAAAERMRDAGVEAVAICLLHSYANPAHEIRVAEIVAQIMPASTYISCSYQIMPQMREYERTSTTVINALLGPVINQYLNALVGRLNDAGVVRPLHVMHSGGGQMSAHSAAEKPACIIESGPAAGVIAAARVARARGLDRVITLDMGGTTAKLALVRDGQPEKTEDYEVGAGINLSSKLVTGAGYSVKLPFIDISEIGAGGGSIAWFDLGGALQVGPQSAASTPGPACYDLGGERATFTDATVSLGYLSPHAIVGGTVKLNAAKARAAIARHICPLLGRPQLEAAYGIYTIAVSNMVRAVKTVSTYRGHDARDFTLMAFGGNGPIVALAVAREMGMKRVLIPPHPGLFSAFGLLWAEPEHELARALHGQMAELDAATIQLALEQLLEEATRTLCNEGYAPDEISFRRQVDVRYSGQAFELSVPVDGSVLDPSVLSAAFHAQHRQVYGHSLDSQPIELVNVRVVATVKNLANDEPLAPPWSPSTADAREAPGEREVYFGPEFGVLNTPIVTRRALLDQRTTGPVIVEEYDSTCVVAPDYTASVDDTATITIERS